MRYLDVLNDVTNPRLAGIEQMLATYPDAVSGGFSVVRNDGGTMRAHFGFVLNSGDPQPCTTGYLSSAARRSPGAVASEDVSGVACDVVNGVDPGGNARGRDRVEHPRRAEHRRRRRRGLAGPAVRSVGSAPAAPWTTCSAACSAASCTPRRSPAASADRHASRPDHDQDKENPAVTATRGPRARTDRRPTRTRPADREETGVRRPDDPR